MFDRFKQTANVAKFKAEQLLHVQSVQNEIGVINQQISGVRERIAEKVLELRQNGPLGIPEVDDLCVSIEGLRAQIAQKEAQIAAIRAETAPQQQPAPAQPQQTYASAPSPTPAAATKVCPSCSAVVPAPAMFCTSCGFNFKQAAAPVEPAKATRTCPHCQFEAPAASAFCPNCGQSMA